MQSENKFPNIKSLDSMPNHFILPKWLFHFAAAAAVVLICQHFITQTNTKITTNKLSFCYRCQKLYNNYAIIIYFSFCTIGWPSETNIVSEFSSTNGYLTVRCYKIVYTILQGLGREKTSS